MEERDRLVRVAAGRWPDVLLAVALVTVGLAEVLVPFSSRQGGGSSTTTCLGVAVTGAALVVRRRWPLGCALVALWTWPALDLVSSAYITFYGQFVPMALALFTVVRHASVTHARAGAAAATVPLLYLDLARPAMRAPEEMAFHWSVFVLVALAGWTLRRLARRAEDSQRRAVAAEVAAAEHAMAAVLAERTRIARELHDIVAHSVTVMVVQAGAAEQVVGEDPDTVREALATVRSTGVEALAEMRRLVGMLREVDAPGDLEPQPGLGALETLVASTRRSGLDVILRMSGTERPLPAGLDLAAYRIVQEALTNVRKHSSADQVVVEVEHTGADLLVRVRDNGVERSRSAAGEGHGLVGMRERAALYGGRVESGATDDGFSVRALLPVAP